MLKPSWCLVVNTIYFIPAYFAAFAQVSGSKDTGLNWVMRFSYDLTYSS